MDYRHVAIARACIEELAAYHHSPLRVHNQRLRRAPGRRRSSSGTHNRGQQHHNKKRDSANDSHCFAPEPGGNQSPTSTRQFQSRCPQNRRVPTKLPLRAGPSHRLDATPLLLSSESGTLAAPLARSLLSSRRPTAHDPLGDDPSARAPTGRRALRHAFNRASDGGPALTCRRALVDATVASRNARKPRLWTRASFARTCLVVLC